MDVTNISRTIVYLPVRFAAIGCLILLATGCGTIPLTPDNFEPPIQSESAGIYEVYMKPQFGKPSVFKGEIDGPITVQTALERSGATSKFRGMDITLMRVVEENGRGLKLPVDYQGNKKMVRTEQDYAIHPNDRLIIKPKSNSPLDGVIDSLLGGFGV